ncbi:prepilin-type N-terminal cleavage/methylation domain-containing protein [Paenibacillus sp. YYML68]|uniref:type IV pilus modification PilV family protein n=1 Tax=Paenibacillus sp. YYML68 TaxID=2909250 RepID=UPI0024920A3E|nr:prepilin-type N-terminal cleavage/methylation domain-containing protein [Paenibacillus sp. YYML68]
MSKMNEKGVSIIELLAAITISSMLLGLIGTLIYQSSESFNTITSRQAAQEKARYVSDHMINRIRSNALIIAQESPNSGVILSLTSGTETIRYRYVAASRQLQIESSAGGSPYIISNVTAASVNLGTERPVKSLTLQLRFELPRSQSLDYDTTIRVPTWLTP